MTPQERVRHMLIGLRDELVKSFKYQARMNSILYSNWKGGEDE